MLKMYEIVDDIIDRVSALAHGVDTFTWVEDIPFEITAQENAQGSWYNDEPRAREDICDHFDFFRRFTATYEVQNDYCVFLQTEKFHCVLMMALYGQICYDMLIKAGYHDFTDTVSLLKVAADLKKAREEGAFNDMSLLDYT